MSEVITVENFPEANILQKTELTAHAVEGDTTLSVENEAGFDTDHPILPGQLGGEPGVIITPTAVNDESIQVPALDMNYKKGSPVYKLFASKARIYRAANVDGTVPSVGDFSLLATISLSGDQLETEYEDVNGGSDYWYLYTLYNDIPGTPEETDKDVSMAIRGGGVNLYVLPETVREEAGLKNNRWVTDSRILSKILVSQDEVDASLVLGDYNLPLSTIPEMVKNATMLLAAGYLLSSGTWQGTIKEGERKIAQARQILKRIEAGELVIVDDSGNVVAKSTKVRGFPDETANDVYDYDNYAPRIFGITDKL